MSQAGPLNSLLTLLGFFLLGTVLSVLLSMSYIFFLGSDMVSSITSLQPDKMRVLQGIGALTQFVLPSLAFIHYERRKWPLPIAENRVGMSALFVVLLITLSVSPLIDQLGLWNERLTLPEGLAPLEDWMIRSEAEIEAVIRSLMMGTAPLDYLGNLMVIALLAAVGEELLFRACLQSVLIRWFKNPHVAIWFTAIAFSAFHLQFFGFLPRLALGALFGYLYFWSGTIWYPMLAHFLNNAFLVTLAFIWARQGKEIDEGLTGDYLNSPILMLSVLLTTGLLYYFRKLQRDGRKNNSYEN